MQKGDRVKIVKNKSCPTSISHYVGRTGTVMQPAESNTSDMVQIRLDGGKNAFDGMVISVWLEELETLSKPDAKCALCGDTVDPEYVDAFVLQDLTFCNSECLGAFHDLPQSCKDSIKLNRV